MNQEKDITSIEDTMPDHRARPSLLLPLGSLFTTLAAGSTLLLGKERSELLLYSLEKGLQDENDEQLRILNEQSITEEGLRKHIREIRDSSYD